MTSRNIFHPGNAVATDVFRETLESICGSATLQPFVFASGVYHNIEAEIVGDSTDLVIIGAHLDSTATRDDSYDDEIDDAPGADDDLSGVTGVFAVAETLRTLANESNPHFTIRFVLFNAEEWNMAGSSAYADALAELHEEGGPNVVAMFQMDMIGWHSSASPPHQFEVHGTGSLEYYLVAGASAALADSVVTAAADIPSLAAQVYPVAGCSTDPATDRSDHSRFHYHDWPACLVSEDLWAETCSPGTQQGNPFYHTSDDVSSALDLDYVADLARCVAQAAWLVANP